jgi:PAS domain S-box-containing protein
MRIDVVGEGGDGLAMEVRADGMQVSVVPTPDDAVDMPGGFFPELVLVSWSASNALAVKALAALGSPARGRLVAAVEDRRSAAEALAVGADDVVFRPIRASDLEARAEALAARRLQAASQQAPPKAIIDLEEVVATLQYNEDQLRAFMDHLPGPAYVRDLEGRHPYVNVAFQELSGRSREFLRVNRCTAWLPLQEAELIQKRTQEIIAHGKPVEAEVVIPVPGSGLRHFFLCEFLMKDSAGRQMVGGISVDQTERELALQALRRSEASLRALIEHNPDALLVHRGGRVLFINQAVMTLLGVKEPGELTSRELIDFIHPDDRPLVAVRLRNAKRPIDSLPLPRVRCVRPDGNTRLCEAVSIPVQFDGQPSVLVYFRDITDRERLQEQLVVTDRLASVGTLAAGVAHEINNPLAWVISGLTWLQGEFERLTPELKAKDAEEITATLREVQQGAERVRHIVKELKTFSRGDDEGSKGVDVGRVLETAVSMAGNELKHRARVVKQIEPTPLVAGNSVRLGQVFLNLIVNAAQSIPEGRADENEVRIRLLNADRGGVLVEVSDTGRGMTPEIQRRAFDPFFSTKAVGEGTGLGLSIVHGIVTRLGGNVAVESTPGKGSTFRVWLPSVAEEEETSQTSSEQEPPKPLRRGRILVIDDEPMIGASIRRTLSNEHEVVAITRAAEALSRLTAGERFDVLISDLMMPEMTGMELYDELTRRWPEVAERVVFLTGGAFTPRAREFLERVPNRRMDKPFDATLLRALVREMVCESCPGQDPGCAGHKTIARGVGMVRRKNADRLILAAKK